MLVQEGFAILGIAVGVALLFASQVASTSLTRSVTQLTREIVGDTQLQLVARGPGGFDERLLGDVRRIPGVRFAFPVLEQQANVIGPHGQRSVDLVGTDPRFAHIGGSLLRRFSSAQLAAQRAIALPAPLAQAIGAGSLETIKIQLGGNVQPTLLGAILQPGDIGTLVNSPVVLAPVAYAQQLAGMTGKITRIFVRVQPSRMHDVHAALARLARAVKVNLEPATFDSKLFSVASEPASNSETLFSAISALVGFMFAVNAMLVTVPARRNLVEDIRLQGATRRITLQILLFDATVLGVLACILGLLLGELLSAGVFRATPGYLTFAFPVGNGRIVTWQSAALAAGAGLTAAVAGVLWPLRHALTRPLKTDGMISSDEVKQGRVVARLAIGTTFLLIAGITPYVHGPAAILGNIALIVSLVSLLPILFDRCVALFERVQRPFNGASPVLAVIELRTPQTRVRSLAVAATAAVAVFGTVEFQGIQSNLTRGLDASAHGIDSSADVWVTPRGESNAFATTAFVNHDAKALTRLPGISSVGLYRGSFLDWGERKLWVLAPSSNAKQPIPISQVVAGTPALAARRVRQGGWAVLSQILANEYHLQVGQWFTLPSPKPTRLRVAALSTNLGWPPGAVVLNSHDYASAWGSTDPSAYEIQTKPGASSASVRYRVLRAVGSETGLAVETASERERRHYVLAAQGLSRLTQIRLLVLIAAILAVTGAMGSMIWQRRDLVAFMKVDGYRRGILWRWLVFEAALLLAAGSVIGAALGLYAQLLGSHFLASITGFPIVFNVELLAAVVSITLMSVVTVAVAALPGYLVVRAPARTTSSAH
ncbi:MAG TPA: FtsX-like permease family protein [Solirubrobacteraceae bacterium]|nr:FtsX-like permease family protein [Solirubrobacteraceae bacterium]